MCCAAEQAEHGFEEVHCKMMLIRKAILALGVVYGGITGRLVAMTDSFMDGFQTAHHSVV